MKDPAQYLIKPVFGPLILLFLLLANSAGAATPSFSNLAPNASVPYGAHVIFDGTVSAPGPVYPGNGETVSITIGGNTQTGTVTDSTGDFRVTYNTAAISASATPYAVIYTYGGDGSLSGATNSSKTLMLTQAALTVTADNLSRSVGTPNPPLTASYSGFVGGQTLATSDVVGAPSLTVSAGFNSPATNYVINNNLGTLSSSNYSFVLVNGVLTVTNPAAPVFLAQPSTQLVPLGTNATLSVTMAGSQPMSFQWYQNTVPIAAATSSSYTLSTVTSTAAGRYFVVAANSFGLTTSPPFTVRTYIPEEIEPGGGYPTKYDFGDMPSTNWTCYETAYYDANLNCRAAYMPYSVKSIPPVIYPTMLSQDGARQSWTNYTDLIWLGSDVTPTTDGTPNNNAEGDPGVATGPPFFYLNNSDVGGFMFSKPSILQEENGIRMIPPPWLVSGNLTNFTMATDLLDPCQTITGTNGNNLFGSTYQLFTQKELNAHPLLNQYRQCYAPGQTVWFTVEAYNFNGSQTLGYPSNGLCYLNVWIDYGDAVDGDNGNPDGKFQTNEYVVVDCPIWEANLLGDLSSGTSYPYYSGAPDPTDNNTPLNVEFGVPNIGPQPYAAGGLQVVSFTIPPMNNLGCGKQAFARFRLSQKPLNLYHVYQASDGISRINTPVSGPPISGPGANTYNLPNGDPSLGEATGGGEVEDYPIYFTSSCPSGLFGNLNLCFVSGSGGPAGGGTWTGVVPNQPTGLQFDVDSSQSSIIVTSTPAWATVGCNITVSDTNSEVMTITSIVGNGWGVKRDICGTGSNYYAAATTTVSYADTCVCAENQGPPNVPTGLVYVSGTDPGTPCSTIGLTYGQTPSNPFLNPISVEQYPYVVRFANTGPNDGSNVVVNWTIPNSVKFLGAAASDGGIVVVQGSTVSFNFDTMLVGDTRLIGLNFLPYSSGNVTNSFTLSAAQALLGETNVETVFPVTVQPYLAIAPGVSNTAEIFYPTNLPGWTLQQSAVLSGGTNSGVWSNVPPVTSPYAIPTTNKAAFFRLAPQ